MRKFLLLIYSMLVITSIHSCNSVDTESSKYDYLYSDLEFEMPKIKLPSFPDNQVNLNEFGGIGDGISLNTLAFEKAIGSLSNKGGGTLVVPSGVWFTGPIVLKSNINLHLEKGALILFSADFNLYPIVETSFEGLNTKRCQSPISGNNLENIAITGEGSINGSGHFWRPLKREKVTAKHWEATIATGGVVRNDISWFPTPESLEGAMMSSMNVPDHDLTDAEWDRLRSYLRPVMISFINCKNILLEGVLFENSPAWNIHPLMCENIIIDNIQVRNPSFSQNGDGLDLESCTNAIVVNSSFDVGDDAICIKSGKDEDGRNRAIPTSNVLIDNCKVFKGHGGFVVGSEMSSGVKNISVTNCQFLGTDVGLRFKSTRGRGGVVENIYIKNINMFDIATEALLFDLYYGGKSAVESLDDGDVFQIEESIPLVDETTPAFKNIYVENLVCRNARRAMYFNGLPEMNIENINLKNVFVTSQFGAELVESKDIVFEDVTIVPSSGPAYILRNITNFAGNDLKYPEELPVVVSISGKRNSNIKLSDNIKEDKVLNN